MTRIAVVGAGLAGLTLAGRLVSHAKITLFEKSRGVGGRMATRYAGPYEFDHGAQFFTARSKSFRRFLQPLIEAGDIRVWHARFVEIDDGRITTTRNWHDEYPHFVGAPRMNVVGKRLAAPLDVRLDTRIERLARSGGSWKLATAGDEEFGPYDWVVLAVPAAQTQALAPCCLTIGGDAGSMTPCYALMLGLTTSLPQDWQAARVKQSPVSWISVNSSKPGRRPETAVVVHSTNAWAGAHLDADQEWVRQTLAKEAAALLAVDLNRAEAMTLHRWRYANIEKQPGPSYYLDPKRRIAACGDWFVRGRVEAAFRSASRLADRLADLLGG